MSVATRKLSTLEKALEINLDSGCYGTFAEIGAGQEVVRWFFQAGGAAGTISKSISAYDMQVSDAIYGSCGRYVSRERLEAMLEHEQRLNRERLAERRGDTSRFFSFADTVSARNYQGTNECHGWLGIRFQPEAGADDELIIIHVRMLDDSNALQQEALGIVGVNLIHSAFTFIETPENMLTALLDGLSPERIEIDMIDVSGPRLDKIDPRILSLRLVQLGLTGAAMFSADGEVIQPSEVLRKRPLLVQRGRFRPITHVNMDLLKSSGTTFLQHCKEDSGEILPLMEISMHNLREESAVCLADFLSRVEVVSTTGCTVMVSDFREYHRLCAYLKRYTDRPIGLAMGLATLREVFKEKYYADLQGGILEGLGRLFKDRVHLLVYPLKNTERGAIEGLDSIALAADLRHLFDFLLARQRILPLTDVAHEHLDIHSPEVLRLISQGSGRWRQMVPDSVARKIVDQGLFGYRR